MILKKFTPGFLLLFCIMALFACQEPASDTQNQSAEELVDEVVGINEDGPIEQYVLTGKLGLYEMPFSMQLTVQGTNVNGSYFYHKYMKDLDLTGTYDPSTRKVVLTESYKGEPSGYFEGTLKSSEFQGEWMASPEAEEKFPFTAEIFDNSNAVDHGNDKSLDGNYFHRFVSFMVAGVDEETGEVKEEEYDAENVLKLKHVANGYYAFFYSVMGANGHSGEAAGILESSAKDSLTFYGESDCILGFKFTGRSVYVSEYDCFYYHGARAWMDGELNRD